VKALDEIQDISPRIIEILHGEGIHSLEQLVSISSSDIAKKSGLALDSVRALVNRAEEVLGRKQFLSGLEIESRQKQIPRLKTGLPLVDKHVGGGFPSGSIVEVSGPQWGGKSLLCIQIGVSNESLGKVVWYDLDGTFEEDTVREIAYRMQLDPESVLRSFHVVRLPKGLSTEALIESLSELLATGGTSLVVIDSITPILSQPMDSLQLARILHHPAVTFLLTCRASPQVSSIAENGAHSRSGRQMADMVSHKVTIEPIDTHRRRIVTQDSTSAETADWVISVGYGGFYQDNDTMKSHESRVREYVKELRNG
jgi:KaiC/GvpD/RAD55 family RecA-like ATPase